MVERGRRDQIIDVAKVLFREKGYHATTIRDIAQQSGLLSGSLYAHIRTKEDLLFDIADEVANQFIRGLEAVLARGGTPTAQFRAALAAHGEVVARNIDAAAVFSSEWRALAEERRATIQAKRDQYEHMWAQILDEGRQTGEFAALDARMMRIVPLSVANWLYQWYDPAGPLAPGEIAGRLADVVLSGLLAREEEQG